MTSKNEPNKVVEEAEMEESVVEVIDTSKGGDEASSTKSSLDEKAIMTIVLDLNGLLLSRCPQGETTYPCIEYSPNRYFALRPGCIKFLEALFERFNVGVWSNAKEENVLSMVRRLTSKAGKILPFFAIWGQEACHIFQKKRISRPDQPHVEAMFKPLAKLSKAHESDPQRTIIIDDSPYKCCVTPPSNCIFPPSFEIHNKNDNILMEELLPYLLKLDNAKDVRNTIDSNRYGQLPVVKDHYQFESFKDVIVGMEEYNMQWSQLSFNTGRLPISPSLKDFVGATTVSQSSNPPSHKDDEIRDILIREGPHVSSMKPSQLVSLARKLGCRGGQSLKAQSARAYINKLLNDYNLLRNQM